MNSALTIGKELNIGNKNIYRTINSKKRTILYSVKQGDSLYRIADIFNIEIPNQIFGIAEYGITKEASLDTLEHLTQEHPQAIIASCVSR